MNNLKTQFLPVLARLDPDVPITVNLMVAPG